MSQSAQTQSTPQQVSWTDLGYLALALIVFDLAKDGLFASFGFGPLAGFAVPAGLLVLCLVLRGPANADLSPALVILTRVIAGMLGAYGLAASLTYPQGLSDVADTLLRFEPIGGVLAAAAALAAFWRPAFVVVPSAFVMAQKSAGAQIFGIPISQTDYTAIVEIGYFFGIGLLMLALVQRLVPARRQPDSAQYAVLLFLAAVAAHFANYFFSGWAKLALDGGPWLWVLQNPTEILTVNTWLGGFLPTSHLGGVAGFSMTFAELTRPLINVSILIGQLAVILLMLRRNTMILITLFYDLTHVVIFLVSGIFFWKWIILNLGLVAAMRHLPNWVELSRARVAMLLILLFAPNAFFVARLGWYDTPALVQSDFIAVTQDGRELAVPSNFFGTISVTAAQHRLGRISQDHYPTVTFGSTYPEAVFHAANYNDCQFDVGSPARYATTPDKLGRIIATAHAYWVERHEATGDYVYDAFPHHIWSNPWHFGEFAALAPDDVSHYLYRTTSGCTAFGADGPEIRIDHSDTIRLGLNGELLNE